MTLTRAINLLLILSIASFFGVFSRPAIANRAPGECSKLGMFEEEYLYCVRIAVDNNTKSAMEFQVVQQDATPVEKAPEAVQAKTGFDGITWLPEDISTQSYTTRHVQNFYVLLDKHKGCNVAIKYNDNITKYHDVCNDRQIDYGDGIDDDFELH